VYLSQNTKALATGHYTNGRKRWPPHDIWSDDQVGVSILKVEGENKTSYLQVFFRGKRKKMLINFLYI
jgi:hypothetical protein